jgi:hypothetical protein
MVCFGRCEGYAPLKGMCIDAKGMHLSKGYASMQRVGMHLSKGYASMQRVGMHLSKGYASMQRVGMHLSKGCAGFEKESSLRFVCLLQ